MRRVTFREGMLLLALAIALGGFLFKIGQQNALEKAQVEMQRTAAEIQETQALKKLWDSRKVAKRLGKLKGMLAGKTLERFELKRNRLKVKAKGLEGRTLNRFLGKIGALPVQIVSLEIARNGEKYGLECQCKW